MVQAHHLLRAAGVSIVFSLFVFSCRTLPVVGVPSVSAYNQYAPTPDGTVIIANAVSVGPGWVVVFADENGSPGEMLGYAPVRDGLNLDIPVRLRYPEADRWYIVQLHKDAGVIGKFEYPGPDEPVLGANGKPVRDRFYLKGLSGEMSM